MWGYSLPGGGGGYVAVEFHALRRDPLKCDSSGWQGVIHRHSVPSHILLHDLWGRGESLLSSLSTSSPAVSACRLLSSFSASQMARPSRLILRWYRPSYRLVETLSSTSLQVSTNIQKFVARHPFVRFRDGAPQLSKDLVCPRLRLTYVPM